MESLKNPIIKKSRYFKTQAGNVRFTEQRYNLAKKVIGKEVNKNTLTPLVIDKIKEIKKKSKRPMVMSVSYWMDKIYSTNTVVIDNESDIEDLKFDDEFMQDYDGEGVPDGRVRQVSIIFSQIPKKKTNVGTDEHNDCLFNVLQTAFNKTNMPSLLTDPSQFKTWCGVGRNDKVDLVEMIPKLEKKLKLNLTCKGSYEYESERKYARGLTLQTTKGHVEYAYYIKHWKDITHGYKINDVRKYPIVYKKNLEDNTVKLCKYYKQGKGSRKIWTEDMTFLDTFYKENPMRKMFFLKSVESEIKVDDKGIKTTFTPEPEDVIDEYIKQMNDFRQCAYNVLSPIGLYVNGTLNPFNSQSKFGPIGLNYWFNTCPRSISDCDNIDCIEQDWLSKSMFGAIMHKKEGTYQMVFEYDINSMYPYLMTVIDFITRKGKYKIVDEVDLSNEYAIYRCVIKGIKDNVMRHNPKNYYTTLDIKTAIENKYKVKLIKDGEPNCLIYSKQKRISGKEVFGQVVDALYEMKKAGCSDAKKSLNYIWGYLASRYINEVNTYQEDLEIDDITNITKIFHRSTDKNNQEHYTFRVKSPMKRFRFDYARFAPFLLAKGRRVIHEATKDHLNNVLRINTDGFLTTKTIDSLDIGVNIGQFKMKSGNAIVTGNKLKWC